jgi:hypothetical protein
MPSDTLDFTAISMLYNDTVLGSKLTEGGAETGDFYCKNVDSGETYYEVGPGDSLSAFRINVDGFPWDNFTQVDMDIELTEVWGTVDDDKDLIIKGVNWNGAPLPSDFSDLYLGLYSSSQQLDDNVNSPFPGSPESKTIDLTTLFEYVRDNAPEPLGNITHLLIYCGPPTLTSDSDTGVKFDTVSFSVTYPMIANLHTTIDDVLGSLTGTVAVKAQIDSTVQVDADLTGTVAIKGTLNADIDSVEALLISSYNEGTLHALIDDIISDGLLQIRHTTTAQMVITIDDVIASLQLSPVRTATLGVDIDDLLAKLYSVGDAAVELETPFLDPLIYDVFIGETEHASIHHYS